MAPHLPDTSFACHVGQTLTFFFFLLFQMQEFPVPTEPQQHVAHSGKEAFPFSEVTVFLESPDTKCMFKNPFEDIVAMAPADAFLQRLKGLEFSKEQ